MLEGAPHDRWFFSALALMLLVLVAAGFAPSFYARDWFMPAVPLPPLVRVHGIIGTAWVLLFALQALLVARARVQCHRRGGVLYAHLFTNGAPLAAAGIWQRRSQCGTSGSCCSRRSCCYRRPSAGCSVRSGSRT